MFPPPMTMPTCTPISMRSRTSWAICCSVLGEMPYLPSPISASPLSFKRTRLNLGALDLGAVTGRGSYLATLGWSRRSNARPSGLPRRISVRVVQGFLARRPRRPGEHLDLRQRFELHVHRARLQLLETPRRRQEAGVERPDRAVVGPERALQCTAELRQMPAQIGDPLVQLAPLVGDLARVRGDRLLLPDVGDGQEQRQQRSGCGEDDPAREGVFVQRRVDIQ